MNPISDDELSRKSVVFTKKENYVTSTKIGQMPVSRNNTESRELYKPLLLFTVFRMLTWNVGLLRYEWETVFGGLYWTYRYKCTRSFLVVPKVADCNKFTSTEGLSDVIEAIISFCKSEFFLVDKGVDFYNYFSRRQMSKVMSVVPCHL